MGSHSLLKPEDPNAGLQLTLWIAAVAFLTAAQIAATLLVPRTLALTLITDVIAFLLMSSALLVFLINGIASTGRTRLFWILQVACWGLRLIGQAMWMYFDLVLRKEAPNPFIGDILLLLSNVPVLAALLLQPHLEPLEHRKSQGTVDFLLLLLWWLYLYLFFVIPWQFVALDELRYGSSYNRLNGLLDVVLLLTLVFLWSHSSRHWRRFYGILFAAQFIISASGYVVNHAIDEHLYYPGSWYDLSYAAALASFTVAGWFGFTLARTTDTSKKLRAPVPVAKLGILAVLSLPVIATWTLLDHNTPPQVSQFRELATLGTMFVMTFLVFVKQHQLGTELAATNKTLREASLTDPLTGLRNRRFFDTIISGDVSQVLRSYATLQEHHTADLIFYVVDLDDFKEVNDRFGHNAGDQVLVETGGRISSVIRNSDVLIRWGGDEFLIVSRYTSRSEARTLASRVLAAVGHATISVANPGTEIRQTCSIGWAAFPWITSKPDEVCFESVLGLADRGVYEAKKAGKNRAIGVTPSDMGATYFIATAGNRVSTYGVQTLCVAGPSPSTTMCPVGPARVGSSNLGA